MNPPNDDDNVSRISKASLSYFQARRRLWRSSPRRKLSDLPTSPPPRTTTKTTNIGHNERPSPRRLGTRRRRTEPSPEKSSDNEHGAEEYSRGSFSPIKSSEKSESSQPQLPLSNPIGGSKGGGLASSSSPFSFGALSKSSPQKNEDSTLTYRQNLVDFYTRHKPEKLASLNVDKILAKYRGREDDLFAKLAAMYTSFPSPAGNGPSYYLLTSLGKIVVKVYADILPITSANFGSLCTGTSVPPANRARHVTFRQTPWHRIVPGMLIQGGDTTMGNGRGGRSALDPPLANDMWGNFNDEQPFLAHDRAGLLSMANSGKNTNSSQFFITLKAMPHLNGKHVVFGEVTEGMKVVLDLGKLPTDKEQRPIGDVWIIDCGAVQDSASVAGTTATSSSDNNNNPASSFSSQNSSFASSASAQTDNR